MKNKRPLAPGFINHLDDYLMRNKPDTWTARTHLVLWYGLLFIIVLTSVCFVMPDDQRQESNVFVGTFLTAILSAIGFIVWLIYLLRFNVFKRFGIVKRGDKVKTFLLYLISVGLIVGAAYIPSIVETIKANKAYGDDEIVNDINEINLAICWLNSGQLPVKWDSDSCLVQNTVVRRNVYTADALPDSVQYDETAVPAYDPGKKGLHIIDTADFQSKKMNADSVVKINDSVFVFYTCPDYNFANSYETIYAGKTLLSSPEIYSRVFKNPAPVDKEKLQVRLSQLQKKYNATPYLSESEENRPERYTGRINNKYGLYGMNNSFRNIVDRKYRWKGFLLPLFIRFFVYSTLVLTLLVYIFRQSTIKTFFLSVLTGTILFILTAVFLALLHTGSASISVVCIVCFCIFLLAAVRVLYSRVRTAVTGIGLNLTVFFVFSMPLIVTALYYQLLRDSDRTSIVGTYSTAKYENEALHYLYAEIIGFLLLLVLIETVFKKLYRTWYALPEQ